MAGSPDEPSDRRFAPSEDRLSEIRDNPYGMSSHSASRHAGYGIGASARRRLAGFARTLRDNGFKVGLAETRDALAILASPAAARPSSLKPALRSLFCATHSDWERFDDIFDAFWRGHGAAPAADARGLRNARPGAAAAPRRGGVRKIRPVCRIMSNGAATATATWPAAAGAKARRARKTSPRRHAPHRRSGRRRARPRARGAARARDAGPARSPRADPPARAAPRSAPHHSPQRVAWRDAGGARVASPQDQAAAPGRAARRLRLDEPLHRVLRPLPARRRRRLPRGRGVRLPHAARACVALAARPRRDARGRPARA